MDTVILDPQEARGPSMALKDFDLTKTVLRYWVRQAQADAARGPA